PALAVPPARRAPKRAGRVLEPLLEDVRACGAVPEGAGFTEKLNRAAYTAGGLVQGGHVIEAEVREQLLDAATDARPHQEQRSRSIINSALSAGAQRPLHPRGRS
ncbi:bifunctional DNA primase/polymerase, partial [Streptomyces mirabilis]